MQVTCRMFLNDEPKRFGRHDPRVVTGRLRCLREITHVLIGAELGRSHGSLLNNAGWHNDQRADMIRAAFRGR